MPSFRIEPERTLRVICDDECGHCRQPHHQHLAQSYGRIHPTQCGDPPGSRVLFVSGQTATDADGNTPPDADTQADIVYTKVGQTLRDAGMDWSDVVKTNLYMVNPSDIMAIVKAGAKHNPGGVQAGTLVYVKALAQPEVLLELEAVAATNRVATV